MATHGKPGRADTLLRLVDTAERRVILIAPFIKAHILELAIGSVREDIPLSVYTRWRPEEIAHGVSDLEVWNLLLARPNSKLFLCQHLHAKCFVSDERALIGSANLTSRGLGCHAAPNLECTIDAPSDHPEIMALLQAVGLGSIPATYEIYCRCKLAAESIQAALPLASIVELGARSETLGGAWLPLSRYPDQLFNVYSGSHEDLTVATLEAGRQDLAWLSIAPGLSNSQFDVVVYSTLFQMEYFNSVYQMAERPRRFGEYRQYTRDYIEKVDLKRSATESWQTALRWNLHYGAAEFCMETPRYSEILTRRNVW